MYKQPSKVRSQYGAPLGRAGTSGDTDEPYSFYLRKLPINSGGYDAGGAYWGLGQTLYHYQSRDGDCEGFLRAADREAAKRAILADYPLAVFEPYAPPALEPDEFLEAYIAAAIWTDTPDTGEDKEPWTEENLAPETLAKMKADCAHFIKQNGPDLNGESEQAGHDFWLTRNHHGAGFWDREESVYRGKGDALTEACKQWGETSLYLGDDGKLYLY